VKTARIAYFAARYPHVSHAFVLREVIALRRLGVTVETAAVRRSEPAHVVSEADRHAFRTTFAILPPRPLQVVLAHAHALLRRPSGYLAALRFALRHHAPGLKGRLWQVFYFLEAGVLWHWCRRRGIRHVHVHFANVAADVAMLAAVIGAPELRWSFTMHGSAEFFDVSHYRLGEKVRRADWVACISDFCRSQLMSQVEPEHWAKLRVVHCGVDLEEYAPTVKERTGAEEPLRLLTVGRLVPVKGQPLLVEAVATLRRRGHDVCLTIIGEGPARGAIEEAIARHGVGDAVRLAGSVGQDEIRAHYAAADIFMLPSFTEGLPVVLMEAMAMGIPVLTTQVTGIPELVDSDVSGVMVRPGRLDEILGALERLVADPDLRRRLGAAGREKIAREFDVRSSARQLQTLLEGGA